LAWSADPTWQIFLRYCSAATGLAGFNFTLEQIRTTLAQIPPHEILLLEEIPVSFKLQIYPMKTYASLSNLVRLSL
jgi:hypothetical protein